MVIVRGGGGRRTYGSTSCPAVHELLVGGGRWRSRPHCSHKGGVRKRRDHATCARTCMPAKDVRESVCVCPAYACMAQRCPICGIGTAGHTPCHVGAPPHPPPPTPTQTPTPHARMPNHLTLPPATTTTRAPARCTRTRTRIHGSIAQVHSKMEREVADLQVWLAAHVWGGGPHTCGSEQVAGAPGDRLARMPRQHIARPHTSNAGRPRPRPRRLWPSHTRAPTTPATSPALQGMASSLHSASPSAPSQPPDAYPTSPPPSLCRPPLALDYSRPGGSLPAARIDADSARDACRGPGAGVHPRVPTGFGTTRLYMQRQTPLASSNMRCRRWLVPSCVHHLRAGGAGGRGGAGEGGARIPCSAAWVPHM